MKYKGENKNDIEHFKFIFDVILTFIFVQYNTNKIKIHKEISFNPNKLSQTIKNKNKPEKILIQNKNIKMYKDMLQNKNNKSKPQPKNEISKNKISENIKNSINITEITEREVIGNGDCLFNSIFISLGDKKCIAQRI